MRIAIGIEYDGTDFHGWQAQAGETRTVQRVLEHAISQVANHPVVVQCAGRTDAGVHALEQIVHFDTHAQRSLRAWVLGTNTNLPPDISVHWAQYVADEFHARFSATARHYRYVIVSCPTRPALVRWQALWSHYPIDEERMQKAASSLMGTNDFSSYRAIGCQAKHPVRIINYLNVYRHGTYIFIDIGADGFLYHMVRNIVGVLMAIGRGERPIVWALDLLKLRDRTQGGVTVAPQGLYLTRVDYPLRFALPTRTNHPPLLPIRLNLKH